MGRVILIIIIGLIIYALYRIIAWAVKTANQVKETLELKNKVNTLEKDYSNLVEDYKNLENDYNTLCRDVEKLEERVDDELKTSDSFDNLSETIKTAIETPKPKRKKKN